MWQLRIASPRDSLNPVRTERSKPGIAGESCSADTRIFCRNRRDLRKRAVGAVIVSKHNFEFVASANFA